MSIVSQAAEFIQNNPLLSGGISLAAIVGSIAVFFPDGLLYDYKRFRERGDGDDASDWFDKTAAIARHVQRVWGSKYVEPRNRKEAISYDEVKGERGLLADQLDRHASAVSQDEIPPEVINFVFETAQECRSEGNSLIGLGKNSNFTEQGRTAGEKAEQLEEAANHRL